MTWEGHAFGLALESSFELAGWPPTRPPRGLAQVSLRLSERAALRSQLPADSVTIAWRRTPSGREKPMVFAHPTAGYWLEAAGFGVFHLHPDGSEVRCGPIRRSAWQWQRFLIGQVLPFASTVHGYEPWHASAVALGGQAVAIAGSSGSGKSTLVVELMLRGGTLLADDVIALKVDGDKVQVHPGPAVMSLRRQAAERMRAQDLCALGTVVGADREELRLGVERCDRPLPLQALYLLEPVRQGKRARSTPVRSPDVRLLLGHAFNFALRDERRLVRQLDVCAAIARTARIVRLRVPSNADPGELADRVTVGVESSDERSAA